MRNIDKHKNIHYHINDLPDDLMLQGDLAIDTEALGLNVTRDRLCLLQISCSKAEKEVYLVHFKNAKYDAPNIKKLLTNAQQLKIFHFARFDLAILQNTFNILIENIYCTKVASRIARTYAPHHGLKDLCHDLLGVKVSKQEQTSDWGAADLTQSQMDYASNDVFYLHKLKRKLDMLLHREEREYIAKKCFEFLPTRALMDAQGWPEDFFAH